MKIYSHDSSNISSNINTTSSDFASTNKSEKVVEEVLELRNLFEIIENKVNNILVLGKKLAQINKKINHDFSEFKIEKNFLFKQRAEIVKELTDIYESKLLKLCQNSTSILSSIANCFKNFLDELARLDVECKSQEETIENSMKIVDDLKTSLENKCAEVELIKVQNSAMSFVNRQDFGKRNDSFQDEIDSTAKLISALSQNGEYKTEIDKLNSLIQAKEKELLNIRIKSEEDKQKINKLIIDMEISASLAKNQINTLQSKVSKYKEKIEQMKNTIKNAKELLYNYNAYMSMLPVLGGSLVGNALFNNKFAGTLAGGIVGAAYNAYNIDNGRLIIDSINKLSRYISK